jgi:Leucine-rich repeat (LRR) protein
MSDGGDSNRERLTDQWAERERLLERFEMAWRSGKRPVIDNYLPNDPAQRLATLADLVEVDLEYRLAASEPARVEEYLERYAEIAAERRLVADLIRAERRLRLPRERNLALDEYVARFPAYTQEIGSLIANSETVIGDGGRGQPPEVAELLRFLTPAQGVGELGRLGPYRIVALLGFGGMGVVFEAEDPHLGRKVALKVMLPSQAARESARARFLREARAAAALEHDHIVSIYHVGEDQGVPYIAMQFLTGETVAERLKKEGKLPLDEALRIGRETALGLAIAHEHGLIHRDIKPANIFLTRGPLAGLPADETAEWISGASEKGKVKILDFGLARAVADDAHITGSGAIVGTPSYMAPEQAAGEEVDHRADLFSLGCVLYHMATGQSPFQGRNTYAVLSALAVQQPAAPHELDSAIPKEASDLIMELINKDRARRPPSARKVASRLQTVEGKSRAAGGQMSGGLNADRRLLRRVAVMAIAVGVLVLAPVSYFFGGTLIRIATNKGELIIDSDDPNLEITIKGQNATVYDKVKARRFVLTAGEYEVLVREDGEGAAHFATKKFTITRGGKETFHARLEVAPGKTATVKNVDRDRRAAEWALGVGGLVHIRTGAENREVKAVAELPREEFRVTRLELSDNSRADDDALAVLEGLSELSTLVLGGTRVTDAGLAHLEGIVSLEFLRLRGCRGVTDAGVKHLGKLTALAYLGLSGTQVTDAGLEHLKGLTQLSELDLTDTSVSGAGLAYLKGLKLTALHLSGSQLDDANFQHVMQFNLKVLWAGGRSRVTSAVLQHVKRLTNLEDLNLMDIPDLDDASLENLKDLKRLRVLELSSTNIRGEGLRHLKSVSSLRVLNLHDCPINDDALQHLNTDLLGLALGGTRITDAAAIYLRRFQKMTTLGLERTAISDKSVDTLRQMSSLRLLNLGQTAISAKGIEDLRNALPKCRIQPPPMGKADVYLERAGVQFFRGDYPAGLRNMEQARRIDPSSPQTPPLIPDPPDWTPRPGGTCRWKTPGEARRSRADRSRSLPRAPSGQRVAHSLASAG